MERMAPRLRIAFTVLGLIIVTATACRPKPKAYALHGQLIAMTPDRRVLTIKHDDIQGFMPAMTMPYEVTDPSLAKDLTPGDIVDATLLVFEFQNWVRESTGFQVRGSHRDRVEPWVGQPFRLREEPALRATPGSLGRRLHFQFAATRRRMAANPGS